MTIHTHITGDGVKHESLSAAVTHAAMVQYDTGAIVSIDQLPPNEGECSLYRWQYGSNGSFERHLWNAISCADSTNLARLGEGFPEHVHAYRRFAHEVGYWPALQKRIES